jgi:hypothetical protein
LWSICVGSQLASSVRRTCGSSSHSWSVCGRMLMYGRPRLIMMGMLKPSKVTSHCLPPTRADLSSTSMPFHSNWGEEWMEWPFPEWAYWCMMRITGPLSNGWPHQPWQVCAAPWRARQYPQR